LETRL